MIDCGSCGSSIPDGAKFCPSCGSRSGSSEASAVEDWAEEQTLHKPVPNDRRERPPGEPTGPHSSETSDSAVHGRFIPGMMVGGRFRIVSLLGRGGMGEVYRGDDLSIGQQVALKFLPSDVARDPGRLERFRQEVRVARQVAHPNVCRVYDIGEVDGDFYISMEYVEGEDLGHLLRRIGRLPEQKAVQIARQIAAGLAAAHDRGLIHRDLKPANVMLDDRGMVRITDFGLAAPAEDLAGGAPREGTPQYMAPEQFRGEPVTIATDLYSLGLVMYELFTGERVFTGSTLRELVEARERTDTSTLSGPLQAVDPAIERVIIRCLDPDPGRRPPSALAVSAALPGGDPLAAALAAGETPSPEMVAAAGDEETLEVRSAVTLWIVGLLGLVAIPLAGLTSGATLPLTVTRSSVVLEAESREILEKLGYEQTPATVASGFFTMSSFVDHLVETSDDPEKFAKIADHEHPVAGFWYRESPQSIANPHFFSGGAGAGAVTFNTPPLGMTGEVKITLDDEGNLWSLNAVPPQVVDDDQPGGIEDPFGVLIEAAGLDPEQMTEVEPEWSPTYFATERRAWTSDLGGIPMRVEAAVWEDLPVYLLRVFPWSRPLRMTAEESSLAEKLSRATMVVLFLVVISGAILLARRNVLSGRGDRRGAFRLATFIASLVMVHWFFAADHVATSAELGLFVIAAAWALLMASGCWAIYIALEPFMRRRWPSMLISWSRLLSGKIRDPLVGRDLLAGIASGAFLAMLLVHFPGIVRNLTGGEVLSPITYDADLLEGLATVIAYTLRLGIDAITAGFFLAFLLFLFLLLFRRKWAAAAGVCLLGILTGLANSGGPEENYLFVFAFVATWAVLVIFLARLGLLYIVVAIYTTNLLAAATALPPATLGSFASGLALPLAVCAGLLTVGLIFALGGRRILSPDLLD